MNLTIKGIEKVIKEVESTGKARKAADGGGLYLEVTPAGGKYWRMKYRFLGKEKRLAFGVYPIVGLQDAREKRLKAKRLLDQGVDPNEQKKLDKLEKLAKYENSFEALAREWHGQKQHSWKDKHSETTLKRLEANVFPHIGKRPISDIKASELLKALKEIEDRGSRDLAHRQLQHCGQIFRYAIATSRAEVDITANLKGALQPVVSTGFAHLSEKELPDFLQKLNKYDVEYGGTPLTKLAFKLLILSFVRSAEIRGAKWNEIDWAKQEWRIPAERMKMNETHIVPLARQSIVVLKEIQKISGDNFAGYIFPSQKNPHKTMSENTFLRAIEVLGYKGKTTGHGFRSVASTILNENHFKPDVIERQLAHGERDQIRAAYNHAEYLKERRTMMQWWADYLDKAYGR